MERNAVALHAFPPHNVNSAIRQNPFIALAVLENAQHAAASMSMVGYTIERQRVCTSLEAFFVKPESIAPLAHEPHDAFGQHMYIFYLHLVPQPLIRRSQHIDKTLLAGEEEIDPPVIGLTPDVVALAHVDVDDAVGA